MSEMKGVALSGVVNAANLTGSIGNGIAYVDGTTPTYEGEYVFTPRAEEAQTILCANKKMLKDVDIKAVPFFETTNESGMTAYIAAEVDE